MAWTPHNEVFDLTQIVDNLLAYIGTNQTDALNWANGGPGLDDFAKLYPNGTGRLATLFPQLVVLTQESETDVSGDALIAGFRLTLEVALIGPDADRLVLETKMYAQALESMLANITADDLGASSNIKEAFLFELRTQFHVIQGYKKKANTMIQIFQTRCTYKLVTESM